MKKTFWGFVALTLAVSCVREPLIEPSAGSEVNDELYSGQDSDEGIVKGWVRIKLNDNSEPLRTGVFTRGEIQTGNPQLDEIVEKLGVTEVYRTIPDGGKFEARRRRHGLHLWYDLKIDDKVPVTRATEAMSSIPGVAHVEPVVMMQRADYKVMPAEAVYSPATSRIPMDGELPFNDPYLNLQWHYNNDGSLPGAEAGSDINLFEGWKKTTGDPDIIVAVIDVGVDFQHPDLESNMWVNKNEIPGNGIDDDGNGYVDDYHGVNLNSKSSQNHYNQNSGEVVCGIHGTHVAGTIAAVNNNGIGVCGVAGGDGTPDSGVRIMTVQIFNPDGIFDNSRDGINGFIYAAENGAVIANCSFVMASTYSSSVRAVEEAMQYFIETAGFDENDNPVGPVQGGLILAATGNSFDNIVYYPAKSEYTVGVCSTGSAYGISDFANRGEGVDIFAPGGDSPWDINEVEYPYCNKIYSTLPYGEYGYEVGTSMACPHATGVAALIASYYKDQHLTADQLKEKLLQCVRPLPNIGNYNFGTNKAVGLVDASFIGFENPQQAPADVEGFHAEPAPAAVDFSWNTIVDANGLPVSYYLIEWAESASPNDKHTLFINNVYQDPNVTTYRFKGKSETAYTFTFTAVDRYGYSTTPITCNVTTLIFENHNPELINKFFDLTMLGLGVDYSRTFNLSLYFTEPDEEYGDSITYVVTSGDESVVSIDSISDQIVRVTPVGVGSTTVAVRATDTRGGFTDVSFVVNVKPNNLPLPEVIAPLGEVSMAVGETRDFQLEQHFGLDDIMRNDVSFSVENQTPKVASAAINNNSVLSVSALTTGTTRIVVTATNSKGESVSDTLTVRVADGTSNSLTPEFTISPNPVDDYISLNIEGFAGKNVDVLIMDGGARTVYNSTISLDADGAAQLNVSKLQPGIYNVRVTVDGKSSSNTFVKR